MSIFNMITLSRAFPITGSRLIGLKELTRLRSVAPGLGIMTSLANTNEGFPAPLKGIYLPICNKGFLYQSNVNILFSAELSQLLALAILSLSDHAELFLCLRFYSFLTSRSEVRSAGHGQLKSRS